MNETRTGIAGCAIACAVLGLGATAHGGITTDPCPWDFGGDNNVGFADLNELLDAWGSCPAPCPWDFNGDGSVGFFDLNQVLGNWGPCPVIIDAVIPDFGSPGDIIEILGRGFDPDPDNNCAVVMNGGHALPLEVLTATENHLCARIGILRPDAVPGPIMVGRGTGLRAPFEPAFPDIQVLEPVWTWDHDPPNGNDGTGPDFTPFPDPPDPGVQWFFNDPPKNGVMCIRIGGNWPELAKVRIAGRLRDHATGQGHDQLAACLLIQSPPGGGTARELAERICDSLRCAWLQNMGIEVNCFVENLGDEAKITLAFPPPGQIDWGNITVCVEPYNPLQIDAVNPDTFQTGDIITVQGRGFGDDPDDLCIIVMNGNHSIPLEAIDATPKQMQARVGVVRPDAQPGPIMIGRGDGARGFFKPNPLFPEIQVIEPVWVWENDTFDGDAGGPIVTPMPTPPPPLTTWFFNEPPANGVMCIYIEGDWPANAKVRMSGRLRDHATGKGYDQLATCIVIEGAGLSALQCAERLCDSLRCAWSQLAGIDVECIAELQADGRVKITLSFIGGSIDWGNMTVCVEPGGGVPCPGDFNGDGVVNLQDLAALKTNFGPCTPGLPCPWDLNGDGIVDQSDLFALEGMFGPCP